MYDGSNLSTEEREQLGDSWNELCNQVSKLDSQKPMSAFKEIYKKKSSGMKDANAGDNLSCNNPLCL